MIYLFDTDHFSIIQRRSGLEYARLSTWMSGLQASDFACCVVSLHEQLLGAHVFLNDPKKASNLVRGYELLGRLPRDYTMFALLAFDPQCATIYDGLRGQNLRIGTMDLRLAAIALTHGLVVLTRNRRDFGRVPGLLCEDRTI